MPRKKLQKISAPERLEVSDSDEELQRQGQHADLSHPIERFQQSNTIVTSKDTEAGGLNLAIKTAKSNKGGPGSSCGPKTQEEVVLMKTEKKKKEKGANKEQPATADSQPDVENTDTN